MGNTNVRVVVSTTGKRATSGRGMVHYRDVDGNTLSAVVLAKGTSTGLKLKVGTPPAARIIDNVAKASGLKQTGVYFFYQGG